MVSNNCIYFLCAQKLVWVYLRNIPRSFSDTVWSLEVRWQAQATVCTNKLALFHKPFFRPLASIWFLLLYYLKTKNTSTNSYACFRIHSASDNTPNMLNQQVSVWEHLTRQVGVVFNIMSSRASIWGGLTLFCLFPCTNGLSIELILYEVKFTDKKFMFEWLSSLGHWTTGSLEYFTE